MARQARTNPIHQTIPSLCKPTSNKRTRTYPINSKYIKAASTKKNSSQKRNAQAHNEDSTEKSCGSHKPSRKTHNLVYADKLHNLLTANINFSARLTHLLSRAEKFPKCYTVLTSKKQAATFSRLPVDGVQDAREKKTYNAVTFLILRDTARTAEAT